MNPPAGPLRTEVNDAVVGGIRERGSEAVGMLIVALARLVIGVVAFLALYGLSSVFGIEVTTWPAAGMTVISGLVSWLTTRDGGGKLAEKS
jgi:hypothetical protein